MKGIRRNLWTLAVAALALTLIGQLTAQHITSAANDATVADADEGLHILYRFRPRTFQEGRDRAPLIILAEVRSVTRGADLVTVLPEEPKLEKHLPTQRITLNVLKVYRGQATPGQQVTLYQTGGITDDYPKPRFAKDNPRYQSSQRYLLLLEPAGQDNLFRPIAPEGRYLVGLGDLVTPMVDNAVTRDLRGKPLTYLEQLLAMP